MEGFTLSGALHSHWHDIAAKSLFCKSNILAIVLIACLSCWNSACNIRITSHHSTFSSIMTLPAFTNHSQSLHYLFLFLARSMPRSSSELSQRVVKAWQPLSLDALVEYKEMMSVLGNGDFNHGGVPRWSVEKAH